MRTDWPVIDEAISFPSNLGTTAPFPYWVSVMGRSISQNTVKRGRQYELQLVQTGDYTPTFSNNDGALSPVNTNGPWAANFQPYCAYRKRAMWPPSVNQLYRGQATGASFDVAGPGSLLTAMPNVQIVSSVPTAAVAATPNLFRTGYANVYSVPVAATLPAGNGLLVFSGFTIYPGLPHSWQLWVCSPTGTVPLSVQAGVAWFDATGTQIGTTITGGSVTLPAGTASWVNVQLAGFVPPANAAGALVAINNVATVASAVTLACAAAQFEQSATCSAFSQPGVWY